MHKYGIDVSLGKQTEDSFGGILIRGLWDIKQEHAIKKSAVVKTIFNSLSLGNNNLNIIESNVNNWEDIFRSIRLNLGQPGANKNKLKFKDSLYKFLAKDNRIYKDYPDKETIFIDSNLNEKELRRTLGYNLKR